MQYVLMKSFATRKLKRSINNQKPKITLKTQNPKFKTQIPNSKPKTQVQNPKPKSKTQNPNWRESPFQNPKPKTQNPKPKTQNPKFWDRASIPQLLSWWGLDWDRPKICQNALKHKSKKTQKSQTVLASNSIFFQRILTFRKIYLCLRAVSNFCSLLNTIETWATKQNVGLYIL